MDTEDVVLVTGFGPFKDHEVNASWEVAKLLPFLGIEEELDVKLIVEEMPVAYDPVVDRIPKLWAMHKPVLVIHLGVSSFASELNLEACAIKSGYCQADVLGKVPEKQVHCHGSDEQLHTNLDLEYICNQLKESNVGVNSRVSACAGRYLCEYIYYTSLNIDKNRALFIHVPDLEKQYSAKQLANAIKQIIIIIIRDKRSQPGVALQAV